MATEAEATQQGAQATQQGAGATPYPVLIDYTTELTVHDYPPSNLKPGDTIVFEPKPEGVLELTFEYGSNFSFNGTPVGRGQTISGDKPTVEVIRPMDDTELKALKDEVTREKWFPEKIKELTLNAWPFDCKLTIGLGYGGGAKTYEG